MIRAVWYSIIAMMGLLVCLVVREVLEEREQRAQAQPLAVPHDVAPLYPHSRPVLAETLSSTSFALAPGISPSRALLTFTQPSYDLCIGIDRGEVRISRKTGRVTFPPGTDLDEASRRFWEAVTRTVPRWQP